MELGAFIRSFFNGYSVTVYFFIAGYVFFLGINLTKETYLRKIHNRFKSLFIPYIMWNTLAIIMALVPCLPFLHVFFPNNNIESLNLSFQSILSCFWNFQGFNSADIDASFSPSSPIDNPLWFVRNLMVIVLFTPIINWTFKRFKATLPILAGIFWFCSSGLISVFNNKLITALFFFSFGSYISFRKLDMVKEFKRFKFLSYCVFILASTACLIYAFYGTSPQHVVINGFDTFPMIYIKNIAILSALPFAYNIAFWLVEYKKINPSPLLSKASFFIYSAHIIFMLYVVKLVSILISPISDLRTVILYILSDIIICIGLLVLYIFMKRYTPRVLSLFTGGRL